MNSTPYDAILFVSFGAPNAPDEVMPFLRNVTRGRNIPDNRLLEVAENYQMFGGKSPLNAQNIAFIDALKASLAEINADLPIYWGNRNWDPYLTESIAQMKNDGVKRALAFVTSAFSSYSGCRQYRENIAAAQIEAGAEDLVIDKIRQFYNHPNFIAVNAENLNNALAQIPDERRADAEIIFTAHSLPASMAKNCSYEAQLLEACQLTVENPKSKIQNPKWKLCFQSRSGAPHIPWLAPDVNDYLREIAARGATDAVVQAIGFLSDHQEVVYDLDTQAQETAAQIGVNLIRAATPGTHPLFVEMARDLIVERLEDKPRNFIGERGATEVFCHENCCLSGH